MTAMLLLLFFIIRPIVAVVVTYIPYYSLENKHSMVLIRSQLTFESDLQYRLGLLPDAAAPNSTDTQLTFGFRVPSPAGWCSQRPR